MSVQKWQAARVVLVQQRGSLTTLLLGPTSLSSLVSFDAVYACGMFDYLQPPTWLSSRRSR